MRTVGVFLLRISLFFCIFIGIGACQSFSVAGNEGGSQPLNEKEANEYKRAVHKCYKTGGTRVVKIQGKLRCF